MIVTLKYMGKMVGVKTLSKYDSLPFPSILHRSGYDILQNKNPNHYHCRLGPHSAELIFLESCPLYASFNVCVSVLDM